MSNFISFRKPVKLPLEGWREKEYPVFIVSAPLMK